MTKIYHNPRCSKSRETLALLINQGISFETIEYLKTPLSAQEFASLAKMLGTNALGLVRKKEVEFTALNLESASDQSIFEAIVKAPNLLERPIVVHKEKAAIGRPPENILSLFL